eukprot:gene7265-biopygen4
MSICARVSVTRLVFPLLDAHLLLTRHAPHPPRSSPATFLTRSPPAMSLTRHAPHPPGSSPAPHPPRPSPATLLTRHAPRALFLSSFAASSPRLPFLSSLAVVLVKPPRIRCTGSRSR